MSEFDSNILHILTNILGEPKRDYASSGDWYEFNCPHCGSINNGVLDGKYNLAVNTNELYCHCWKCSYHAKLSKLIKYYGSQSDCDEYREEIKSLKERHYYTLSNSIRENIDNLFNDNEVELPKGFRLIDKTDKEAELAYQYLLNRGLNDSIIEKFKIGYIPSYKGKYSNRIIIPSYDSYNDLNYWIARDYTGKSSVKVFNPFIDKKTITFNENYINWYEPITLVEGPFDHIVVPNSIPLLGKSIDNTYDIYNKLIIKSHSYINIFLDDDAIDDAYKMYVQLNDVLPNRIKLIICPDGYDASDYYKAFGYKGIIKLLRNSHKIDEYQLNKIKLFK